MWKNIFNLAQSPHIILLEDAWLILHNQCTSFLEKIVAVEPVVLNIVTDPSYWLTGILWD